MDTLQLIIFIFVCIVYICYLLYRYKPTNPTNIIVICMLIYYVIGDLDEFKQFIGSITKTNTPSANLPTVSHNMIFMIQTEGCATEKLVEKITKKYNLNHLDIESLTEPIQQIQNFMNHHQSDSKPSNYLISSYPMSQTDYQGFSNSKISKIVNEKA